MPSILHRLMLGLSAVVFVVLLFPAKPASTSYVYVPLATRVEKADLVVIGKVIRVTPNYYKAPENNCGRGQAVLMVTEVLRGKFEALRAERTPDSTYVQTIGIRYWDELGVGGTSFFQIVLDPAYKDSEQGIWCLRRSDVRGVYCIDGPGADRLDQLVFVRKSIRALDSNYSGANPGFPLDDRTWLQTYGNKGRYSRTSADVCVLPDGALFVEGSFSGELYASDRRVLSTPDTDHFLARLGANGTTEWIRALGSGDRFDANPVAGLNGSCVLIGEMNTPCRVFDIDMPWIGGRPHLMLGISREGKVRWALTITDGVFPDRQPGLFKTSSLPGRDGRVTGIAFVTGNDAYHFVSSFTGEVVFDGRHFVSERGTDWLLASIGPEGQVVDTRQIIRGREENIQRLVLGPDNRLLVGGWSPSHDHQNEAFVAAIASDGKELWTRVERGPRGGGLIELAVMLDGTVVTTMQLMGEGYPSQQIVMSAWSSKGKKLWQINGGGSDIEVGADGNIYCFGSYGESFRVAPTDMPPSAGDQDLFLACYDRAGKRIWVRREGGLSGELGLSLHLVGEKRAILSGDFSGTSPLAGKVVKPYSASDAFVMNVPLSIQKH